MRQVSQEVSEHEKSRDALTRLHLMHRQFVGPTTAAEKLPFVFEELTRSHSPAYLYAAGWTAIEAGISATASPKAERVFRIRQANDALEAARDNALEWAFQRAERERHFPEYSFALRVSTTMAFLPLFESLARGEQPDDTAVQECYESLLQVSLQTSAELARTKEIDPDRVGGYIGLLTEQHLMLAINRKKNAEEVAVPSLERADDGNIYRSMTHDVQKLQIEHGRVVCTTPFESKSRLKPKHMERYDAALIGGNTHFKTNDIPSLVRLTWRFDREEKGMASRKEIKRLNILSREILHQGEHYHMPEELGKRCLGLANCQVA